MHFYVIPNEVTSRKKSFQFFQRDVRMDHRNVRMYLTGCIWIVNAQMY